MAFIKYKSKERALKSTILNSNCPNCKSTASLQLIVWLKYFTLYWIPFIPLKKRGEIKCTSCKNEFKLGDIVDGKFDYNVLKSKSRVPIWTFTGLFLLLIILFISINGWMRTQEQMKVYINHPQVNDRYAFKVGAADYTLYKLKQVTKDSVYYIKHKEHVNLSKYLKSNYDDSDSKYNPTIFSASKKEIKVWFEEGLIRKIIRD